jgi:branched-chain amino acid transport system substrate-binding protein
MQVMFEGVKKAGSVKPADVSKALGGATIDTLHGPATMRAQDHQLLLPNYVARVKTADGQLRPVVEHRFGPEIAPAPSSACKL